MPVDELAGLPIGSRIQVVRERKGKTRPVVAGLVGRSEEWLKSVERGRRNPPDVHMLVKLAGVLGVDLAVLVGEQQGPFALQGRTGHAAVAGVREAIEAPLMSLPTSAPVSATDLARRTADAWSLWHSSPTPRDAVGAVLPQIITDGRRAARALDGVDRRRAHAALSSAYALSGQLLAWVADSALLWLAADRCMSSAEQADEPQALASAAWVVGNVWRSTGREDDALQLADDAGKLLAHALDGDDDEPRALWGAVRAHGAITAAKMGREGDALRRLDDAADMAARLPSGYAHPATLFGAANAALTGISVQVELHKGGSAVLTAEAADPDAVPSLDRRARVWLEVARGYRQRKENIASLHVLQRAARINRESMTCHPLARTLAGELVTTGGNLIEREARALAADLGVAV
ncbi:helix-turn-helix domain-containing protein [Actinokineospora sp. PR83]|uniref:helix-turn-helix domain-containing protein n=1 Tax=Actinokineospora sp. PR83 TaxID=2884908 RepID=UPI001F1DCF6C|nr:helix-turn-helix domain-containing protein [Actinokineospora sp. PR83]MCG8915130.1 helix-turn-helix domain-containing protein [Actinokineospora sp. PR83]